MSKTTVAPKPAAAMPKAPKLSALVVRHRDYRTGAVMKEITGEAIGKLLDVTDWDEDVRALDDPEAIAAQMRIIAQILHDHADDTGNDLCFYLSDRLKELVRRVEHLRHFSHKNGLADVLHVESKKAVA